MECRRRLCGCYRQKGLTYFAPALNSNSVAGTVAKCMDMKQPFVAPNDFSKPASQRQLLTDSEINGIRSQLNLPPINDGTTRDAPDFEEPGKQGAVRGAPQFQEAQATGRRLAVRSTDKTISPGAARTLLEDGMAIENRAIADRMSAIQGMMPDRHSEYWSGPKAEALQQEYRDLIEVRDSDRLRGYGFSSNPEGTRTPIPSSINADEHLDLDDRAVADRMDAIQSLMADRRSEYWSGPKAEALQQEYRDIIERRDQKKRRDEDLFAYADAS